VLPQPPLLGRVLGSQALGVAAAAAAAAFVATIVPHGPGYVIRATLVALMMALLVVKSIARGHAFDRFGAANVVTTLRAALVAAAAGLIGEAPSAALAAVAAALALTVALLDGVDGWLARRTAMATPFGARFDMEVDAFLILVLAMLAWTLGKAGSWVVLAGAMRYLFLAAGFMWRWVSAPLPPSSRRKAICVLQIAGLAAVVSPLVTAPASVVLALLTVATLAWSFAVDTLWLRRNGV
jgi:phosphatidylglycerophosphate synthase